MSELKTFEIRNPDLSLRFNAKNYGKHLREAIKNLRAIPGEESWSRVKTQFSTTDPDAIFLFDGEQHEGSEVVREALFFENTDYPLVIRALGEDVKIQGLYIATHNCDAVSDADDDGSLVYGTLNFHNQVGKTDISVHYTKGEQECQLAFRTEVLSYKMDYRTDLKQIISDIEQEYSMLSYSFLKQTYLSYKEKHGDSTDLIWWQIFSQCYDSIVSATKVIIDSPKRRLKREVRNERAERLRYVSGDLEREYAESQDDPHHLYRIEDLILSKDTVENRFLKYALKEIHRRFGVIREHIRNTLKVSDEAIASNLAKMDEELGRLNRHPFFRQIGQFKGFSQDSLVMKKARGYSDIYRNWLLLQCGYELEDGIRHLEVKDVSELYEIWCFIKVKNMVQHILGDGVRAKTSGKELTSGFVKQLVYGQKSEVSFYRAEVELATVAYNAEVEEENSSAESAIEGTSTFTTIQRPDIVLRLSKTASDDIVYTYLFDAKYRLADTQIEHCDVPPVDAINQMHRYRDAIYYDAEQEGIKREVVGGYVLYPGEMDGESLRKSYYHRSHEKIGIGAFPLKPGGSLLDEDGRPIRDDEGRLVLDPNSSEAVLYEQIRTWLEETNRREKLLQKTAPQKGLYYTDEDKEAIYMILSIDKRANKNFAEIMKGESNTIIMGRKGLEEKEDIQAIRYIVPVTASRIYGYYRVKSVNLTKINDAEFPIRIRFEVANYRPFELPAKYGLTQYAFRGDCRTREKFYEYYEKNKIEE